VLNSGSIDLVSAAAANHVEDVGALTSRGYEHGRGHTCAEGYASACGSPRSATRRGVWTSFGTDLGSDDRCRILFASSPTLTGGMIGPWATVNGTNYATYGAYA
jgi:hypothetical protein